MFIIYKVKFKISHINTNKFELGENIHNMCAPRGALTFPYRTHSVLRRVAVKKVSGRKKKKEKEKRKNNAKFSGHSPSTHAQRSCARTPFAQINLIFLLLRKACKKVFGRKEKERKKE